MRFSVLIANYNNSGFLEKAIKSVLSQSWYDWEIVIVDDQSTDDVQDIIDPYLKDDRIRFYQNDRNMGCGYTKKRCVELAQGSILGFLDADDALHADALQILSAAHTEFPAYSLIHSTHFVCNENLEVTRVADYPRAIPSDTEYLFLNDGRVHHFAVFKKSRYQQTIGIDGSLQKAVDQDLYYKLEETGPIMFIDRPLYYYRIHAHSISTEGNEAAATLWHLAVIIEACRRRIRLVNRTVPSDTRMKRQYQTKLMKTKILLAYRRKAWFSLVFHLLLYPFSGGSLHMIRYVQKWRKEGKSLLRHSFSYDHQIQP